MHIHALLLLLAITTPNPAIRQVQVSGAPPPSQPHSSATPTTIAPHPSTTIPPLPQPPPLPRRCKPCPPNNSLGLTCYKNILCIPVSLLCSSPPPPTSNSSLTNSCPTLPSPPLTTTPGEADSGTGGTGITPEPVLCNEQDQGLCIDPAFLPLPSPGVGNIRRDISTGSCLKGSFFSLYPSTSSGGNHNNNNDGVQQKYIQSCVSTARPSPSLQQVICQDWEYPLGASCFLRLCGGPPGQELSCAPPFTCRKPSSNSTTSNTTYGVCSNSTHPTPDDDGTNDSTNSSSNGASSKTPRSKREQLLFDLLIVVCVLVALTALMLAVWHFRKRYLQKRGRYLPWTRQDKIDLLRCLVGKQKWNALWAERRERLKVMQEREMKWSMKLRRRQQRGARENNESGDSQDSLSMYSLNAITTEARSTRSLQQQQHQGSSSSIPLPSSTPFTVTATSATTPTIPIPSTSHQPSTIVSTTTTDTNNNQEDTQPHTRPTSQTDSESNQSSLIMNHQTRRNRSVLDIFARRWQQQQQQEGPIARELEPPPLYHQGSDLPAYHARSPEPASAVIPPHE